MLAFIDDFVRKFKQINVIIAVSIKSNNPLINPHFINKALGKAKDPAPNAQAIKANILALKEPGFKGPKYLVKQFLSIICKL